MTKGKKIYRQITSRDIFQAYEFLLRDRLISFPLTLEGERRVEAIVANINNSYYDTEIYSTAEEKAVAYFYFIIKDHPFTDGNKRTAVLVFLVFCNINKLNLELKNFELDQVAVLIEKIRENDHQKIIRAISRLLFPKE